MIDSLGELHHLIPDALEHLIRRHARPAHLANEHACEYAIGIRVARPEAVERLLPGARRVQHHLASGCRDRRKPAPPEGAPVSLEWIVTARIDDGECETRLLITQIIQNALQRN